jgi:hypothetical protein
MAPPFVEKEAKGKHFHFSLVPEEAPHLMYYLDSVQDTMQLC